MVQRGKSGECEVCVRYCQVKDLLVCIGAPKRHRCTNQFHHKEMSRFTKS